MQIHGIHFNDDILSYVTEHDIRSYQPGDVAVSLTGVVKLVQLPGHFKSFLKGLPARSFDQTPFCYYSNYYTRYVLHIQGLWTNSISVKKPNAVHPFFFAIAIYLIRAIHYLLPQEQPIYTQVDSICVCPKSLYPHFFRSSFDNKVTTFQSKNLKQY